MTMRSWRSAACDSAARDHRTGRDARRRSTSSASSCAIRSASSRPIWRAELSLSASQIGLLAERVLFRVCRRADSARHLRSTATARKAACWSARRCRRRAPCCSRSATTPTWLIVARVLMGLGSSLLSDGAARALCAALSAGAICHPGRHPDRRRHARHAAGDRAACVVGRADRLARDFHVVAAVHAACRLAMVALVVREDKRRARQRDQRETLRESIAGIARGGARALVRPAVPHASRWLIRASCWWSACGAGRISRISTATVSPSAATCCSPAVVAQIVGDVPVGAGRPAVPRATRFRFSSARC